MNKNKSGLVLGTTLGLIHLAWSILVATGAAQPLINFIYRVHFLNNPFTIQPFDVQSAATLIVVTFAVGYVVGCVFASLWNKFHGQSM